MLLVIEVVLVAVTDSSYDSRVAVLFCNSARSSSSSSSSRCGSIRVWVRIGLIASLRISVSLVGFVSIVVGVRVRVGVHHHHRNNKL